MRVASNTHPRPLFHRKPTQKLSPVRRIKRCSTIASATTFSKMCRRPFGRTPANQRAAKSRHLSRFDSRKTRRDTDTPFVDIYINKPGLAAIAPTALMYKSTTRNSLIPAEAWMAVAAIEPGRR
jgi:hypothetical protein